MTLEAVLKRCRGFLSGTAPADAAHDLSHIKRVVSYTSYLTDIEKANDWVTLPAAWLHDCAPVPKDSPQRSRGSQLAAEAAKTVSFGWLASEA